MKFVAIFFGLFLLIPVECSSAALRRGLAALSITADSKPVFNPSTSLLMGYTSFARQQKQPWQRSKSIKPCCKKIDSASVRLSAINLENKELTNAIRAKNWIAVERIIDEGAVMQALDKDHRTPLTLAIIQEAPFGIIKKILLAGAVSTIREKDKHGFDAYVYALTYGPGSRALATMLYAVETAQLPVGEKNNNTFSEKSVLQMILDTADLCEE